MKIFVRGFLLFHLLAILSNLLQCAPDSTSFKLGVIEIIGNRDENSLPIPSASLLLSEINIQDKNNIAEALNLLPGITFLTGGPRNESVVYLHGFDLRQVPLYIDGIPVSIPYDGMIDLGRFSLSNVSALTANKGIASLFYGANAIGGSINIVTRKPTQQFEYSASAQYDDRKAYKADASIGALINDYYIQGSFSQFRQDYYVLSEHFSPVPLQNDRTRVNSQLLDQDYFFRVGCTPAENEEFALSFVRQHSEKGNPTYIGNDTRNTPRFWRWPYWDKSSVYLSSAIPFHVMGFSSSPLLKINAYIDFYKNALFSYDDSTYTSQLTNKAFQSFYQDITAGAIMSVDGTPSEDNLLRLSAQVKSETHHEHNNNEPIRTFQDITTSLELEDQQQLCVNYSLFGGLGANYIATVEAQNYNSQTHSITNFQDASNFSVNAQGGFRYTVTQDRSMAVATGYKTRFPTMKDRYSYRLGQALPNPALKPERAWNFNISYTDLIFGHIHPTIDVFYSDLYDVIQRVDYVSGSLYQLQNTGHASQYGCDLSSGISIAEDVRCDITYSYLKRVQKSNPSLFFTDTPEHKVEASCNVSLLENLHFCISGTYNSKRYSTTDGLFSCPGFVVFDLQGEYAITNHVSAHIGVKNMFDENYAYYEGYPEPGRTLSFGIALR